MDQNPPKDTQKALTMPANVRAVQVLGLLDEIGELGSGTQVNRLAEKIDADIAVLLPLLNAAEMLGLVRSENGSVFLTDDALKLQKTTIVIALQLLKDRLTPIEPFASAVELAKKKGSTTAKEVADMLMKRGIQWTYQPDENESIVRSLLLFWGIRAGLLTYDGKSEKFKVAD